MGVCVSNDFDIRHIIIKIINSDSAASTFDSASIVVHQENINHFDIEQLQSRLRRKLYGKRFLLVLDDDIWNDDRVKWIELKDLLKVGTVGSKVLATTRSNSIALMMGTVPSYVLKGLSIENCLSLFVKWAFKEGEEDKYPNLVEIGKEIVKKCAGVPLAVRTLGSCLFSKFDLKKWELVRDSEIWTLEQKQNDILPALKLSYDQMPSYLRHCFAYIALYPKDHTFYAVEFNNLWIALGLVQSWNGSEKQEEIVREYINELNSRSFLQDFKDFGYFCKFKVHDLVHDLALYVAKEEFVVVKSHILRLPERVKHLSIVENVSICDSLFPKSRSVRTILFPIKGVSLDSETLLNTWVERYKYLRVLDLRNSLIETLPNSIAKLERLCVLILSNNCKIKRLPNSICKLLNLQVLLLNGCMELETLPKGLGKLISLREFCITTKQSVLSLDKLTSLKHLRKLGFHYCDNLKLFFSGEQQLPSLETLYVKSCGNFESLPLYIFPKLQTLIIFDCKMLNLYLNNESPIRRLRTKHLYIGDFPELLSLPEWIVGATATLETLEINNFPNLKMFSECLTTMSHLKRLYIIDCPQLLSLPSGMHRLTTLDDLRIYGCSELYQKYRPQFGEYWPMISHIKHVFIGEPRGEGE